MKVKDIILELQKFDGENELMVSIEFQRKNSKSIYLGNPKQISVNGFSKGVVEIISFVDQSKNEK